MRRIILVGLGLIGGSLGLAVRQDRQEVELVGIDTAEVLQSVAVRRLLGSALPIEDLDRRALCGMDADLVVLAIPVGAIIASVGDWLELGLPVTDCGSTKKAVVTAAQSSALSGSFVPGHPMAGRERGGFESATGDLFRGRRWIVCPAGVSSKALGAVRHLIESVGAIWTEMTPEDHDAAVAVTSHLPQLLASWLAVNSPPDQKRAAGPAFADMTRIAGGAEAIWRDIFSTNARPIAAAARKLAHDFARIAIELDGKEPNLDHALHLLLAARDRPRS